MLLCMSGGLFVNKTTMSIQQPFACVGQVELRAGREVKQATYTHTPLPDIGPNLFFCCFGGLLRLPEEMHVQLVDTKRGVGTSQQEEDEMS
eukprot:1142613-Pelagomonas_calceolata.AAC.1